MPDFNKVMVHSATGKYMTTVIEFLMSAIDERDINNSIVLRDVMEKGKKILEFKEQTSIERTNY